MPHLPRFLRDEDGNATVEFMLIFPIIVLWLAYSFLFFDAFKSNTQTEKVAFAISDIMSRHDAVDATDLDYVTALQEKMLPWRVDRRATRISSICFEDGVYKVLWSHAKSDPDVTGFAPLTDQTVPLDIMPVMAAQDSVILTEVSARWSPVTSIGGLPTQVWSNALVDQPRYVRIIPHATLNPSTLCPKTIGSGPDDGSGGGSSGPDIGDGVFNPGGDDDD
ncbi:MAG: hypothetical protein AAFV27_09885 [Pseudomonadota bacterium]